MVTYRHETNPIEEVVATCEEREGDFAELTESNTEGWILLSARECGNDAQSVYLSLDNAEAFFNEGLRFVTQLRKGR